MKVLSFCTAQHQHCPRRIYILKTWSHTDNIKLILDYSEAGEGTAMEICVSMRLISLK